MRAHAEGTHTEKHTACNTRPWIRGASRLNALNVAPSSWFRTAHKITPSVDHASDTTCLKPMVPDHQLTHIPSHAPPPINSELQKHMQISILSMQIAGLHCYRVDSGSRHRSNFDSACCPQLHSSCGALASYAGSRWPSILTLFRTF